ncbi:MAG: HzsA-related protein, partial [Planctomycetota bacterium]
YHDVQAKLIHPRGEPDGRSSVVTEEDPHGKLYCLNVYLSDLEDRRWMPSGSVKRLRVLEGAPLKTSNAGAYLPAAGTLPAHSARREDVPPKAGRPGSTVNGLPPVAQRRILGEIDVEGDGSFNIEVPADTPVELQILDAAGMALRSCGWIWAKNHEPRGCVGCHEDGELTPENVFAEAVQRPSISLCLPAGRRRTVDFRRDVMPIIEEKCVSCHGRGEAPPRLDGGLALIEYPGGKGYFNRAYESLLVLEESEDEGGYRGEYVHPGRARTSPLIWHIFGRNTSRAWDGAAAGEPIKLIPAEGSRPLSHDEKRTLVEWIDMGAMWDGIPGTDNLPGKAGRAEGERR